MKSIWILLTAYIVVGTIKNEFSPKLAKALKANRYDLKHVDTKIRGRAQRKVIPLKTADWALRIADYLETLLLILMVGWLIGLAVSLIMGIDIKNF